MTTYYVNFTDGDDANNGLGPDASHASNKPWKTMAKVLGAAGIASGDTVYMAPGSFREVVTVAMTSAVAETSIIGDPQNTQGFKTSGGALVPPADVIWTAYTTNDTSAPSASSVLTLAARDFLTFQYITFVNGTAAALMTVAAVSTNCIFRDCAFLMSASANAFFITGTADTALDWIVERCVFLTINNNPIFVVLPTSASADYDANFQVRNCLFIQLGSAAVNVTASGAASFKGGGVDVLNCTLFGTNSSSLLTTASANNSTSIPCTAYNNLIVNSSGASLNANTSGQILEDFNRIIGSATRTNVTPGANTITGSNHAPLLEVGQALLTGRRLRPFGSPMLSSPLLGFGSTGSPPSVDFSNRTRPSGGASLSNAVGYLERHDGATQETSVTQAGSSAWKITGPGDHDVTVPVDAGATTLTIYARYDSTHDATNKPQAILLANGALGISGETVTMTAAADTWEQLTFSQFTPTAKGTVTLRLVSRPAGAGGIAYFDTVGGLASSSGGFDYFRNAEPFSAAVGGGATAGSSIFASGIFGE